MDILLAVEPKKMEQSFQEYYCVLEVNMSLPVLNPPKNEVGEGHVSSFRLEEGFFWTEILCLISTSCTGCGGGEIGEGKLRNKKKIIEL